MTSGSDQILKAKDLLRKQDDHIAAEVKKQDGLAKLSQSPTTNSMDIEKEMRNSKLAIEEFKYNKRKLTVSPKLIQQVNL